MIIPLITMYLWSISHYIPIKILLNHNKSPVNRSLWGVDRLDSAERAALAASVASAQKEAEEAVPWRRVSGALRKTMGKWRFNGEFIGFYGIFWWFNWDSMMV
jgi:hypothetical protein